jgi:UDP-MurNAc hydroxylase
MSSNDQTRHPQDRTTLLRPDTPTLEFLGHAGCLFHFGGVRILCDPWISDEGAFLGAWHQFPPNDFLNQARLYEADYLFISHDHADHLDRAFLADFPKEKVTVLLANHPTEQLFRDIQALGFRRIERLPDWQPLQLADGLQVRIIKDQSYFKLDSALVIEAGGMRFVDRNDCPLTEEIRSRLRAMGVDLLLLQFSGAMWYPAAYRYPPARQREIAAELRATLLDRFVQRANSMGARHVVHAAGPPCFLDEELLPLNDSQNSIFHDQQEVFAELQRRLSGELHLLLPGDRMVFNTGGDLSVARSHPFDFAQKEQAIEEYRQRRGPRVRAYLDGLPRPEPDLLQQLKRHLGGLFGASKALRAKANVLVRFEVTGPHGGAVEIDLRDGRFTISASPLGEPNYEFSLDGPIARLLADDQVRWEEVLLSMRFRANRDPDEYNWPLFALLRYGHDAGQIRRIEELLEGDTTAAIDVQDESTCYTIQRYCPHLGEDLAGVPIQDGKLVCPRHGWTFDLRRDGECISGGNLPLRVFAVWEDEEREGEV